MASKSQIPKLESALEAILAEWGGPGPFAREFRRTYDKAKPGSPVRARMLEKVMDFMKLYAQLYGGEEDDVENLDEKQLQALMVELSANETTP